MTLVSAMALGADCIEDCDVLRAGRTGHVLGHRVAAPSTLGTFLRSFTFGHVRQLDRVLGRNAARAWQAGAGPGDGRLVVDVDSFVGEVFGRAKQGAAFGYTRVRGYHPILATRADTGEVLHIRLRTGSANTARGMRALLRRADRARRARRRDGTEAAARRLGVLVERTPSSASTGPAGSSRSVCACESTCARRSSAIDESEWTTLRGLPADKRSPRSPKRRSATGAWSSGASARSTAKASCCRLGSCSRFSPTAPRTARRVEAEHRQHAVVELAIRDLKDQALAHFPSGRFFANAAWTVIAALAHNLLRWTRVLGLPGHTIRAARTVRRRLLALPGRLTRSARRWTLHLPARWPWQHAFVEALTRIRALPTAA